MLSPPCPPRVDGCPTRHYCDLVRHLCQHRHVPAPSCADSHVARCRPRDQPNPPPVFCHPATCKETVQTRAYTAPLTGQGEAEGCQVVADVAERVRTIPLVPPVLAMTVHGVQCQMLLWCPWDDILGARVPCRVLVTNTTHSTNTARGKLSRNARKYFF